MWGKYYASKACLSCTQWRSNVNASRHDRVYRKAWTSGLINIAYRHEAYLEITELRLNDLYKFFIFTRSDVYFVCTPPLVDMYRESGSVTLPDLNGHGGYTDRFVICPAGILKHCATPLYRPLLDQSYVGPGGRPWGSHANPEIVWHHRLFEEGLVVNTFNGTFLW